MKKVCVIGHFGFAEDLLNGQTIKTKMVTKELDKHFGADQVVKIDTHGGAKSLPSVVFQMVKEFKECDNIIIFPAHNGIKIFVPLCNFINLFFHRRLHYVVIGGWLPSFLKDKSNLKKGLTKFNGIYVETATMKRSLYDIGLNNVIILRNFKDINPIKKEDLQMNVVKPLSVCTFSRVMKEKGIEDLIAVSKLLPSNYTLDIYGEIKEDKYRNINFNESGITYHGVVSSEQVLKTLIEYDLLLLPSYREGYPGIIIEAMSVGIPCVSTYAGGIPEIVEDGYNGRLVIPGDVDAIKQAILSINATNYSQYSGNALKKFEEEFESDKTNKRILEIIMH